MSTYAAARDPIDVSDTLLPPVAPLKQLLARRLVRKQRKSVALTGHLPWSSVALRSEAAGPNHDLQRPPAYVLVLAAAAVLLHGSLAWYFSNHHDSAAVKPTINELALQFERPKPPEPKIEPPTVEPRPQPKQQLQKQAQVLPPIQTAAPEPSSAPAASSELPVAVAPIVSAPEPTPLPVTAPIGRAGYLNNPPPQYPPMALRQGWQGTVVLRVHVQANGKPDVVEVQKSSGRKLLDDEAVRTVKNLWSYTPAKQGNNPIDGWTTTPIEFQIDA